MEKKDASSSTFSNLPLLCQEDNFIMATQSHQIPSSSSTSSEYLDDDFIKLLSQKETLDANFGSSFDSSWLKVARLDATNWIFRTQTQLGFRNQTAYLSVTYFDRFLSVRRIDEDKMWAIRLLSIACLSIAAKVEESKVPALSDYATEHDFRFDWQVVQKMELIVLSTLGWKMNLITPFAFIHYFIGRFSDDGNNSKLDEFMFGASEMVMSVIKEIYLIEYRPSIIAAAAVLATIDWQLTRETLKLKMGTVSLWETSENQQDQLISCYSIMQRLSPMNNLCTPNTTTEVDQTMLASTSDVGAKRKLSFSDSEQDTNLPEKISRR